MSEGSLKRPPRTPVNAESLYIWRLALISEEGALLLTVNERDALEH